VQSGSANLTASRSFPALRGGEGQTRPGATRPVQERSARGLRFSAASGRKRLRVYTAARASRADNPRASDRSEHGASRGVDGCVGISRSAIHRRSPANAGQWIPAGNRCKGHLNSTCERKALFWRFSVHPAGCGSDHDAATASQGWPADPQDWAMTPTSGDRASREDASRRALSGTSVLTVVPHLKPPGPRASLRLPGRRATPSDMSVTDATIRRSTRSPRVKQTLRGTSASCQGPEGPAADGEPRIHQSGGVKTLVGDGGSNIAVASSPVTGVKRPGPARRRGVSNSCRWPGAASIRFVNLHRVLRPPLVRRRQGQPPWLGPPLRRQLQGQ
jgi:hypothetical protein